MVDNGLKGCDLVRNDRELNSMILAYFDFKLTLSKYLWQKNNFNFYFIYFT